MLNIAMLGLGTVGQGIIEILNEREKELEELIGKKIIIKKILVDNINKKRDVQLAPGVLTNKFQDISEDNEIEIIVEVTSSLEGGYEYIKESLKKGKHVVSANKAILSKYFEELIELANRNKVGLLYEASVAGGIPVLKPLKENLVLNEIDEIQGILNGTCNYILTRMLQEGLDYRDALQQAQDLGYAEANPAADVEGHDTLRKLRILSSLGLQSSIREEDIILEGIDRINSFDLEEIKKLGLTVKLIGEGRRDGEGFIAFVMPAIIGTDSYFANVNGVFNSVSFKGSNVGELKFYGPGAGKLATANAVISDLIDIALGNHRKNNVLGNRQLENKTSLLKSKFYLRVSDANEEARDVLKDIAQQILRYDKDIGIITKEIELGNLYELLRSLNIEKKKYFLGICKI